MRDCYEINQKIAKALKDIEEGRVYSLESICGDENETAWKNIPEVEPDEIDLQMIKECQQDL
jgi:hypothetical protein